MALTPEEEMQYIALLEEDIKARKRLRVYPKALEKLGEMDISDIHGFLNTASRPQIIQLADACAKLVLGIEI